MVGPKHIGKLGGFQMKDVCGAGRLRDEIKNADTPAVSSRNRGKFAKNYESGTFDTGQGHVRDNQRPFTGFQLRHKHLAVTHKADAPSFGIQDLLDGTSALGSVIEDKNTHLLGNSRRTSTHKTDYSAVTASPPSASRACDVSGKGAWW